MELVKQKKLVVIYTNYYTLSSKSKYKLGFYVNCMYFFEKCCNGMGVLKEKYSVEMNLYVMDVSILESTLA